MCKDDDKIIIKNPYGIYHKFLQFCVMITIKLYDRKWVGI